MRQIINISLSLIPLFFCLSCISHGDGLIQEREIFLKLVTDIKQLDVFIKPAGQEIQIFDSSGVYHFKTPELSFHTPIIAGIALRDNIWDIPDFLKIKKDSEVISVLSCEDIWNLKKDRDGNSLLIIKD